MTAKTKKAERAKDLIGEYVKVSGVPGIHKVIGVVRDGSWLSLRDESKGRNLIEQVRRVRLATKKELAKACNLADAMNAASPEPARPPLPGNFSHYLRLWAVSRFLNDGNWPNSFQAASFFGVDERDVLTVVSGGLFIKPPDHLQGMIIPFSPPNTLKFSTPGRTVADSLRCLQKMIDDSMILNGRPVPTPVIRDAIGGAVAMIMETHDSLRACGVAGFLNLDRIFKIPVHR